jgi:1,4-alpha-glucan branching enzyme
LAGTPNETVSARAVLTPPARARDIAALVEGRNADPFALVGPHMLSEDGQVAVAVRVWYPSAVRVLVIPSGPDEGLEPRTAEQVVPGFFNAIFPGQAHPFVYRLKIITSHGLELDIDDPYRFGSLLGDVDLHLLGEGTHYDAYKKLGAHPVTVGGVPGTHFAVWVPNAERVSVVGDFNQWDGRVHPMRFHAVNGIWDFFLPGHHIGQRYKYEIRSKLGGEVFLKTDPYGVFFETPPDTASIVWDATSYTWQDAHWMEQRASARGWFDRPMSIYEVHLGSWDREETNGQRQLTYRELGERLVPYVKEMGFTHIELLPVMEHPFYGSWGYQVIGFFAPTSRYGTPQDFKWFIDECHRQGIGVILDWVPGHFPKDAHGLARFDGSALFEHADPRQGEHQDWGTLVFNYGRNEVRNFLLTNALYWLEEYHADGLRVDAVASLLYLDYSRKEGQWVPNKYGGRENLEAIEFIRQLNTLTHERHPGTITIAEESTAWPAVSRPVHLGGLGFSYKWNMGWMHDTLKYLSTDPYFRPWEHNQLTFSMLYTYNENFILPFSHDEVVYGKRSMLDKMPGDDWQKAANLRMLYGYLFTHPGKKLLFMGGEFGQWWEWNHDFKLSWSSVDMMPHAGIRAIFRDLNRLYRTEPALYEMDYDPAGFQWVVVHDHENSVFVFMRMARNPDDRLVVALNFTPVPREHYRVGVPVPGRYKELMNSDAAIYGGSNTGNGGAIQTEQVKSHGFAQSLDLILPPLAILILKLSA